MAIDRGSGLYSGRIYITWANASDQVNHRKPDILLIRSTDGGASWSSPVRVNSDTGVAQTDQWMPWINVDSYGGVNVVFYDSRMDPTNNLMTQVYLARSLDGGATFRNYQISDTAFSPSGIPGTIEDSYMGDYIGVTSTSNYILPVWNDNRSGIHRAYTARFGPLAQVDSLYAIGWNMTSIPNVISNFAKSAVYPTATTPAYRYENNQYIATDPLYNGRGWWIKFDSATRAVSYAGLPIDSMSMSVATDWNITGSISTSVLTSQISSDPPGIVTTPIYKYVNGYVAVTTLAPGGGYWVKVNQNGKLKFSRTQPKVTGEIDLMASLDKFTISDSYVGQQDFYFRNGGIAKIEDGQDGDVELPPDPPFDAFNVRPKSGKFIQAIRPVDGVVKIPIDVKRALYPIKLEWNTKALNGLTYWLIAEDSETKTQLLGSGSITIQSLPEGVLRLEAIAGQPSVPTRYSLDQNYPNPFNPQTTIHYELPEAKHVRLVVYDVLGREIATLVDEKQGVGGNAVLFNGINLPSGVYFYRIDAGSFVDVKKMILMR